MAGAPEPFVRVQAPDAVVHSHRDGRRVTSPEETARMIKVSRLDGSELILNADLIETVEATPNTVLSLVNGDKFVVRESADDVVARVIAYRQHLYHREWCPLAAGLTPQP
jgi:flagellar protein FlbD